jgi:TolB protein
MQQSIAPWALALFAASAASAAAATGCGKGPAGGEKAPVESLAKATPATGSAAAAAHADHDDEPTLLAARKVTWPARPGGGLLGGSLLLGEGAQLARLDMSTGALAEIPPPGPGLRLFPTAVTHAGLLAAIAILDRGEEHVEQLALVDLTGKQATRLVGPAAQVVRHPSFSADGAHLFFEASHKSFRDLYRLELPPPSAQGAASLGETSRLTDNREGNFAPALSPDGERLAFASSRDGDSEIYTLLLSAEPARRGKASSSAPAAARLTAFHRDDWGPVWNPAKKSGAGELAFLSDRESIDRIFIVGGDGTGLRRATAEPSPRGGKPGEKLAAVESQPAWSSQGQLAYLRTADNRNELIVGAPGTSSWRTLTAAGAIAEGFAWSPDGQWLAAIELPAKAAGHAHARLFLLSADGKERHELLELEAETTVRWVLP